MPQKEILRSRQDKYMDLIQHGVAVVPSAQTVFRNGDSEFPYRQHSDLLYLSGASQENLVLVLRVTPERREVVAFIEPRDAQREQWDGPRLGIDEAPEALGVDQAFPFCELDARLPEYFLGVKELHFRFGQSSLYDASVIAALTAARQRARKGKMYPTRVCDPSMSLHELRLRKEPRELLAMREAAKITVSAHGAAFRRARDGAFEFEVESELLREFRARGADAPAYESIVASGPNATILHYRRNQRQMRDGDLLLIDAGCEFDGYAADLTRTAPVSGKFSDAQRELYGVVLDAQKSAISAIRPGTTLESIHETATRVLVEGLVELGLLVGEVEQNICEGTYRRYFMHGTSHWLGLDVHDVGAYYMNGNSRPLEEGFVLTVEPGLYIGSLEEAAPSSFRGLGVRIEDDVVVTKSGYEVLTNDAPKEVDEVEAWVA